MIVLPLAMVPGFAVPLFIIAHRMAWEQLRAAQAAGVAGRNTDRFSEPSEKSV